MRRTEVFAWLFLASITPAFAAGGLWCNGDDATARFAIRSGMQTGGANGMFDFDAEVEIRLAQAARDFRHLKLGEDNLSQHWLDAQTLKLELYAEREEEPFGYVRLVVDTMNVEEGAYAGGYTLTIFDMPAGQSEAGYVEAKGKVTCGVE